jgi:hypothetical protein
MVYGTRPCVPGLLFRCQSNWHKNAAGRQSKPKGLTPELSGGVVGDFYYRRDYFGVGRNMRAEGLLGARLWERELSLRKR